MFYLMAVIFVLILTSVILYVSSVKFKKHLIENWPALVVTLFLVLLGATITIIGVYWAFQSESDRIFHNQLDIFKRNFPAITEETAANQALIKRLKKNINVSIFELKHMSTVISGNLIRNPFLYKYAGQEYLYALDIYLNKTRETNLMLDYLLEDFKTDGKISESNIKRININLDDLLYYTYILQYQSQFYVYLYGDVGQLRPGNQEQIMKWILKKEKITVDELRQKLEELSNLSREQKEKLFKSTMDTWKRVRKK